MIARAQLLALGMSRRAIEHRIAIGRLHSVRRGVYAVGRRELTREGEWMAAILACGGGALLSHESAAALWRIRPDRHGPIEVSVPGTVFRRAAGIRAHRRATLAPQDRAAHRGIPLTSPVRTILDLATRLASGQLERTVNEADKLDLVDPETLRAALDDRGGQRGVRVLRGLLDRDTFRLTDSELERRFLRLAREAGLPPPETQARVCGFRVDFHWPELGLVVETDGLRYHRTPAQQARDARRDQALAAAGLTCVRFTHADVRHAPRRVVGVLGAVRG